MAKVESPNGRERGDVVGEGAGKEGGSQPSPHQLEGLGSAVSSPSGVRDEPRPPKGFPVY